MLHSAPLTESYAMEIFSWQYENEYSVYNYPQWGNAVRLGFGITDPDTRAEEFVAILGDDERLIGFYRLIRKSSAPEEAPLVLLGVGLAPKFCGLGIGKELVALAVTDARDRYPGCVVRLQVRQFNQRAIKCYSACGFRVTDMVRTPSFQGGSAACLVMELAPGQQLPI